MPTILPYRGVLPTIAEDAFIAPDATVVGDVEIGARSSVWFGCVLRGDVNHIRIGAGSNIQDGTVVHVDRRRYPAPIGDAVLVGHACVIHACTLEDRAYVGMNACVMDGAVVEGDALVAAGALVAPGRRVPAGQLWAGRPAAYMRELTPEEVQHMREATEFYAERGQEYREQLAG